jgi:hypothetical protein
VDLTGWSESLWDGNNKPSSSIEGGEIHDHPNCLVLLITCSADRFFMTSGVEFTVLEAVTNSYIWFYTLGNTSLMDTQIHEVGWWFPAKTPSHPLWVVTWSTSCYVHWRTDDVIDTAAIYQCLCEIFVLPSVSGHVNYTGRFTTYWLNSGTYSTGYLKQNKA